ncbi:unnamed protein product [Amoebophrya sp. A25]|nr:unnamed protein product [Amoebophrya sp. A25]|eukprot:GSA25T00007519001.1
MSSAYLEKALGAAPPPAPLEFVAFVVPVFLLCVIIPIVPYVLLWLYAAIYMVISCDARGLKKLPPPPPESVPSIKVRRERTIFFLRHGESEWNFVFNKKPVILAPFRLVYTCIKEFFLFGRDSLFLDSPLNTEGLTQAAEAADIVEKLVPEDAVFVASPLRRAVSTLLLAFEKRLQRKRVKVWHCLQEISRNVDTASITPARETPPVSRKEQKMYPQCVTMYDRVLDVSGFEGNKTLGRRGVNRIQEFARKIFDQPELRPKPLVVGAHSLYFKHFFNIYLPELTAYGPKQLSDNQRDLATLARTKKIHNGGLVSFVLQECETISGQMFYRVRPGSIKEVYKGFEGSKKTQ